VRSLLLCLVGTLSIVSSVRPARAEDKTVARDHWERGTKFYDLGKYDDAIREFEAAYEAKSDPAFLYNLAQSHRLAGHPTEALRLYRTYLRYVPKAPNRVDIEDRMKELERVIAERGERGSTDGTTTAPPAAGALAAPSGATTSPPASSPPAPQAQPAGASPPSGPPNGPPVGAGTGAGISVAEATTPPNLVPSPSGAPTDQAGPTTATSHRSSRRTAAIAIGAGGGGFVLLGALFGALAQSKAKAVETAATNGERFDPATEKSGKAFEGLQWVGYGVGVAGLVTGAILYATSPPREESAQSPRVAVAPLVAPGSGGALLRLIF
jgi:tetratricopeptide (TPR) repeat protein